MPGNRPGHRRPDGMGHLALDRRRGKWRASISIAGERRDRLFPDEATARRWLADLQVQARRPTGGRQLADWMESWLAEITITAKRGSSSEGRGLKTLDEYRKKVRRYIIPQLGHLELSNIRPDHITEWRQELLNPSPGELNPISPRTINTAHTILAAALQMATDQRVIDWNPAKSIKHLKVEKQSAGTALTLDDWQHALDLARESLDKGAMLVLLAGGMGMRRGEALGLKWHNVNLAADPPYLICGDSLQQVTGHGLVLTPGKNKWSRRSIPIPRFMVPAFKALYPWQRTQLYVVADPPRDPGRVEAAAWYPIRKYLMAKPDLRLHDLRHTLVTLLMTEPNLNESTVKMFIGHAPAGVTETIYTHLRPEGNAPAENLLAVAERIDQLFNKRKYQVLLEPD